MLNPRLRNICEFVDSWCNQHKITYTVVCDENDLQGMLLFKKDNSLVGKLLQNLAPIVTTTGIHLETTKVRGGTIFAFSIKAISESKLASIIAEAGEEIEPMSFSARITDAFTNAVAKPVIENSGLSVNSFLTTAIKVVDEGQYKLASQGATRANQTSLQRQRLGSDNTLGGPQPQASKKAAVKSRSNLAPGAVEPAKGPKTPFESRVSATFGQGSTQRKASFNHQLNETLQGMATPSGANSGDLFGKFAQALTVLGNSMGTGPLQDQLKQQGINWKKSDDGSSVIMYVVNGTTNAPQPIARISSTTLEKPSDFEAQLLNIMDFAKGDAPGTFKQRQQEYQDQEKAAREIAKQLGPQDQSTVTQQMQPQQPGLQGMATPDTQQAPAPAPMPTPAPQAAAQQAAMPKPGM